MADKKKSENGGNADNKKKRRTKEEFDAYDTDIPVDETDAESEKNKRIKKEKKPIDVSAPKYQVLIAFLAALALFVVICYAFPESCGTVGEGIRNVLFGIFGGGAFLIPFLLLIHALYLKRDLKNGAAVYKIFFSVAIIIFTSLILNAAFFRSMGELSFKNISEFFENGKSLIGGGVVGGVLGSVLISGVGIPGTLIFSILFLVIFAIFLFGLTPGVFWKRIGFYYLRMCEKRQKRKKERAEAALREKEEREKGKAIVVADSENDKSRADIDDIFTTDFSDGKNGAGRRKKGGEKSAEESTDNEISETLVPEKTFTVTSYQGAKTTASSSEQTFGFDGSTEKKDDDEDSAPWDDAFSKTSGDIETKGADPIRDELRRTLDVTKRKMREMNSPAEEKAPEPPVVKIPEYRFPPIDLLKKSGPVAGNSSFDGEIQSHADKLIKTLSDFNVRANIVNVSRGPTITRYEIGLEAGTRVKAITNLIDDIALALATNGVRFSGVIPGKSAIGIEVPNESKETVHLRELIENPQFMSAKSKLNTALGRGVAGEPVYLDIAKMPHLLVAGTTGSGKSVCINTMLISILYKARPDEVRLVLIDPKKVEFKKYNGIPHLLVPVVSDPKKAAGALNWCVTEMERRFGLIEAENVSNLDGYNKAIENDPTKEKLPQIVIAIDELADLMMTASDEVESSICRIAQKARAAGMHLIVGTQRPSVDVVTGLIKANIPSRIALAVKSQVDSRTMIDTAGAEKLMGHGDMLYAPIGSMNPMRVQGAFVSDEELEDVISFVKDNGFTADYSDEIMSQIEKEAALCGQKKGKIHEDGDDELSDDDGEEDPKLRSVIELAVESGKISTSLIQRRFSLGYGRAAKLIDVMEKRGIVSGPNAQKPRDVLITKEQYLEMMMNNGDKSFGGDDRDDEI